MEVAIIVIVVFVILMLTIIAVVRFCNKFDCCGCCDGSDDSMDDLTEGHDSDTIGEEDNDLDLEEEEEILAPHEDDPSYCHDNQITISIEGEEYVVNKMEESLL